MLTRSQKTAYGFLLTALMFSVATPLRAEFMFGKVMKVDLEHKTSETSPDGLVDSGDFIVDDRVELPAFGFREANPPLPALVDIDISDTQISLTLLIDQPFAIRELIRVLDANNTIDNFRRVDINPATNWAGLTPSRIVNAGNVVSINVSQLAGLAGQQILLDVIPEPATWGLVAAGVASLAALRRKLR